MQWVWGARLPCKTKSKWLIGDGFGTDVSTYSIDADLPIAVDDEYWFTDDGQELFQQPANKPSKIQFFTAYIQLLQIVVFSLRTVVRAPSAIGLAQILLTDLTVFDGENQDQNGSGTGKNKGGRRADGFGAQSLVRHRSKSLSVHLILAVH